MLNRIETSLANLFLTIFYTDKFTKLTKQIKQKGEKQNEITTRNESKHKFYWGSYLFRQN